MLESRRQLFQIRPFDDTHERADIARVRTRRQTEKFWTTRTLHRTDAASEAELGRAQEGLTGCPVRASERVRKRPELRHHAHDPVQGLPVQRERQWSPR